VEPGEGDFCKRWSVSFTIPWRVVLREGSKIVMARVENGN
jgi:hypothetical protein